MQAVVEGAEHTHQCGGLLYSEMQMLRRVEDQRRIEDGEAERREDLNEEQRSRSLRSRGEKALERFHLGLLCCSTRGLMSSGSQARTLRREAASLFASRSRAADDSVLVNGARETRDIEGKVTRVGASELGRERISKPSAPAMLVASLLQGMCVA